jgi:hypothetical protein
MSLFVGLRDGLALLVLVAWPAVAVRIGLDARRRLGGLVVPAAVVALGIVLPFAGAILYLLARPARTRSTRRYSELRLRYLEHATAA